jgi:hypothetical protein
MRGIIIGTLIILALTFQAGSANEKLNTHLTALLADSEYVDNHAYDGESLKLGEDMDQKVEILNKLIPLSSETQNKRCLKRRDLLHVHLQSSNLYGNSTELQYFYVDVFLGS